MESEDVMQTKRKVYFIHEGGTGMAADFFIEGIQPISSRKEAEKVTNIDYYMPVCKYVKEFLKEHPEYVYVGSTDNMHTWGWGMNFDGYEEVECPENGLAFCKCGHRAIEHIYAHNTEIVPQFPCTKCDCEDCDMVSKETVK